MRVSLSRVRRGRRAAAIHDRNNRDLFREGPLNPVKRRKCKRAYDLTAFRALPFTVCETSLAALRVSSIIETNESN